MNFFLQVLEYLLPPGKLFSSTLHTIILGLRDKRADFFIKSLLYFFFNSPSFFPSLINFLHSSRKLNSSFFSFFLLLFSNRFYRDSRSDSRISVSIISRSRTGSTSLFTFCIFLESKHRVR